jgi:hypothetical protein
VSKQKPPTFPPSGGGGTPANCATKPCGCKPGAAVVKIAVKIKATPALTARPGTPPPADHTFDCTETAEAFPPDKSLVAMRGDLQEVELKATVQPADTPVWWDVRRAPDDNAAVGGASDLPTLSIDGSDHTKAKLKLDQKGSFFVRAFADCSGSQAFVAGSSFRLLPTVLVDATLVVDNSVTHTAHINPTIGGGSVNLSTGSFNIANPNTEAIHMNVTADVVSGGADGRRLLDRAFAGWINNESQNENIRASYSGGHSRFSVFASNRGAATGPGRTFLPGNPAPVLVPPSLLDSGRPGAGTGGETATLTSSRIRTRTPQAVGQRWLIEAIDSPGDSAPLVHPHAPFAARIQRYHFELHFSAFLSFWTNRSGSAGATGDPADRVYAVLRSFNWDMLGEWTIDAANNLSNVTPMSVTISGAQTNVPLVEAHRGGGEVRPPTGLSLLANDATT